MFFFLIILLNNEFSFLNFHLFTLFIFFYFYVNQDYFLLLLNFLILFNSFLLFLI